MWSGGVRGGAKPPVQATVTKGGSGGLAPRFRPWRTNGGPGDLPPGLGHRVQEGAGYNFKALSCETAHLSPLFPCLSIENFLLLTYQLNTVNKSTANAKPHDNIYRSLSIHHFSVVHLIKYDSNLII